MIDVSERALQEVARRAALAENEGKDFRIFLDSKRCDGFGIGFGFDVPIVGDNLICIGETVVMIHANTALVVSGGMLDFDPEANDFVFELRGADSFKGKFFKKGAWDDRSRSRRIELLAPLLSN